MHRILTILAFVPVLASGQWDSCPGTDELTRLVQWEHHRMALWRNGIARPIEDGRRWPDVSGIERVCAVSPVRLWVAVDTTLGHTVVFASDSAGTLFMMQGDYYTLPSYAGVAFDADPQRVPIPGLIFDSTVSLCVCGYDGSIDYTGPQHLRLAVTVDDTAIGLYDLRRDAPIHETDSLFRLVRADTLELTPSRPGQCITALAYDPANHTALAMGTHGMLRVLHVDTAGVSLGVVADSCFAAEEQITCYGMGYVGTELGRIYRQADEGEWQFVFGPADNALRHLHSFGAVGDSGLLIAPEHTGWTQYSVADRAYRYHKIVHDWRGHGILSLDSLLAEHYETYRDSPTVFASSSPSDFVTYDNGVPYPYAGAGPDTFRVTLSDPEGNVVFPEIVLVSESDTVILSHVNAPPKTDGIGPCPDIDSSAVGVKGGPHSPRVGRDEFQLIVGMDSVKLVAVCERKCYTVDGYGYYEQWYVQTVHSAAGWSMDDTVTLSLSGKVLQIVNEGPNGITSPRQSTGSASPVSLAFGQSAPFIRLPVPAGELLEAVEVHDPRGRRIALWRACDKRVVRLPRLATMGTYVVSLRYRNGRRDSRCVVPAAVRR
ncbi:MAG: hypothetical protein GF331_01195 [Chitinivibrionales bacterium]|nr:hypothetical protein [Chitinivibrionales bacterium]